MFFSKFRSFCSSTGALSAVVIVIIVVLLLLVLGIVGLIALITLRRKHRKLHVTRTVNMTNSGLDNPISKLHHHKRNTHRTYTSCLNQRSIFFVMVSMEEFNIVGSDLYDI